MNVWTVLLMVIAALAVTASAERKIICYFGSWAVYRPGAGKFDISDIDANLCTHLMYTFVGLGADGSVKVLDPWQDLPNNYGKDGFGRFNKLREQNPQAKTLISMGGWSEGSTKYSKMVANPSVRANFVQNVVNFVQKYGFNGFDLDWEYPNQRGGTEEDKQNYVILLKELKKALSPYGLLLSVAVGAAEPSASQSYFISEMSQYVDIINLMTYDLHGSWESTTGINAPLYARIEETGNAAKLNVDAAVNYWIEQGAPAEKLIVGVPFYGRTFTLRNPGQHDIGAPTTGPGAAGPYTRQAGFLGYNEICEYIRSGGWNVVHDSIQRTPYAYNGNQWIGYDDVISIKEKAEYVKNKELGGVMLWSIETDDFKGRCGERYPLLKTLNYVLRNGLPVNPLPDPILPPKSTPSTTQTPKPTRPPSSSICSGSGLVADPKDCGSFYQCVPAGNGYKAIKSTCPPGTLFDRRIGNCNYEHLVDC